MPDETMRELSADELKAQEVLDYFAEMPREAMSDLEKDACQLAEAVLRAPSRPAEGEAVAANHARTEDAALEREFDRLLDLAKAEPISEERLARIREGVLRRRFGTDSFATHPAPVAATVTEAMVDAAYRVMRDQYHDRALISPTAVREALLAALGGAR